MMATDLPSAAVTWRGRRGEQSLYFYYGCDMQRNRAIADRLRRGAGAPADRGFHRTQPLTTSPPHDEPASARLSDRARDVFRMVVEAYLESGQPVGSRTISRTSGAQSVARLDPQRDAGSGGDRACSPRRTPRPGGCRPRAGLRLFVDGDHAGRRAARRGPGGDRGAARPRRPDRGGDRQRHRGACPASPPAPASCWCPSEEPALKQLAFVPLSAAPGGGGDGRQRRQRRESRGRPAARASRPRRSPRSAIMSARASPA